MVNGPVATSPFDVFDDTHIAVEGVTLAVQPRKFLLNLRGDCSDEQFNLAVKKAFAVEVLPTVNRVCRTDALTLFGLGPDEWLVRIEQGNPDHLPGRPAEPFRSCFDGSHHALVDVTDYYCHLALRGPAAEFVLCSGTPLDIGKSLPDSSYCAQTRFANAAVLLERLAERHDRQDSPDECCYLVQVRWSFADYLWRHLRLSVSEYPSVRSI